MAGLLTNSTSSASLDGWSLWQGCAEAGDGALHLSGTGTACIGQAIGGLAAGTAYTLSLQALGAAPGSYVGLTFTDARGRDLLKAEAPVTAAGTVLLDGIVAPAGTAGAYVWAWKPAGGPALAIDDVQLAPTPANLLRNADFETRDALGWQDWTQAGEVTAPLAGGGGGSYGLDGRGFAGISQGVVFTPASQATAALSLDARVTGAAAWAELQFYSTDNQRLGVFRHALDPGIAHHVLADIAIPDGAAGAYVCLWKDSGTAALVVDNIRFTETVLAPAAPSPPAVPAPPEGPDLASNGSFARGLDGWSLWDGHAAAGDGMAVLDGAGAACIGQAVAGIVAGEHLAFSISATPMGSGSHVGLTFTDAAGHDLEKHGLAVDHSGSYGMTDLVAPAGAAGAYLWAWKAPGAVSLTVDDAHLTVPPPAPLAHPEKLGLGIAGAPWQATDAAIGPLHLGWYYDWQSLPEALHGPDFVPMIWGAAQVSPGYLAAAAAAPAHTILGFNEPDSTSQAGMGVQQALDLWPQLEATGARLGSPATTDPLGGWMQSFMQGAAGRGARVDFVAIHYYADSLDVGRMQWTLETVHALYGKPVWVTEWAPVDWSKLGKYSAEQLAGFYTEASRMMDGLDFVERQAWFSAFDGADGLNGWHNAVLGQGGALTPVGQALVGLVG